MSDAQNNACETICKDCPRGFADDLDPEQPGFEHLLRLNCKLGSRSELVREVITPLGRRVHVSGNVYSLRGKGR